MVKIPSSAKNKGIDDIADKIFSVLSGEVYFNFNIFDKYKRSLDIMLFVL